MDSVTRPKVRRWRGHGVPFVYISGHIALHSFKFKLPPDWWWRRYCRQGTCAYDNFMCPNGCPEDVMVDDWS